MPGMDGFELLALLKASERDIPTIFISAHNDEMNVSRAEAAGGVALLDKTRVLDTLHDVILMAIAKQYK
jgi:CheY-like chemotaxis protein